MVTPELGAIRHALQVSHVAQLCCKHGYWHIQGQLCFAFRTLRRQQFCVGRGLMSLQSVDLWQPSGWLIAVAHDSTVKLIASRSLAWVTDHDHNSAQSCLLTSCAVVCKKLLGVFCEHMSHWCVCRLNVGGCLWMLAYVCVRLYLRVVIPLLVFFIHSLRFQRYFNLHPYDVTFLILQ